MFYIKLSYHCVNEKHILNCAAYTRKGGILWLPIFYTNSTAARLHHNTRTMIIVRMSTLIEFPQYRILHSL